MKGEASSASAHVRRIVGHASGWQEQMDTCVCGKPWPCSNAVAAVGTQRDEKMMADPEQWPRWPCLPLKKLGPRGQMPEHGFLLAQEGMLTTVHIGSIFSVERVNEAARGVGKSIAYPSTGAIVAAGWLVD
jgi:hypothetical protein